MKDTSLEESLIALGPKFLANRLIELSHNNELLAKELQILSLKANPEKLAKKINQQISGLKRSSKFIHWNQTHEITDKLDQIMRFIEDDLLPQSPELATACIEKLFNIEESIYERADDSSGCIGTTFSLLVQLWGKAWEEVTDRDLDHLCAKLVSILKEHDYYSTRKIIPDFAQALGTKGLDILEKLIGAEKSFSDYALKHIYTDIADVSADPDKYIDACKKYGSIDEDSVCKIAERLLKKLRTQEAINWLLHQPEDISLSSNSLVFDPNKVTYSQRFNLLLEAYDAETMTEEAQSVRWILFKKTLSVEYFKGLLKHQSDEAAQEIKTEAYNYALNSSGRLLKKLMVFLYDLQDYDTLARVITTHYSALDEEDYTLYRPLSKNLDLAGFPLPACLLRRKLIHGILNRAISKYYKYAISDLNLAVQYAGSVKDWGEFKSHNEFIQELKSIHGRKSAFWSKLGSTAYFEVSTFF